MTKLSPIDDRKNYILATKHKVTGAIVALDLPPMSLAIAESKRKQLAELMPKIQVYVINTQSA